MSMKWNVHVHYYIQSRDQWYANITIQWVPVRICRHETLLIFSETEEQCVPVASSIWKIPATSGWGIYKQWKSDLDTSWKCKLHVSELRIKLLKFYNGRQWSSYLLDWGIIVTGGINHCSGNKSQTDPSQWSTPQVNVILSEKTNQTYQHKWVVF